MRPAFLVVLFLVILLIHLVGIQLGQINLQEFTKPILVPVLVTYFVVSTKGYVSPLKKWVVLALFFSWLGDILLMFQEKDSIFFLLGLSAFLVAHIFYILFFNGIRSAANIRIKPALILVVAAYYIAMMSILYPYLGEMKVPVLIYGSVISYMLLQALHILFIKHRIAGQWLAIGAFLFVVSDTLLAFNKFYAPFGAAGLLVMVTYGSAQLFISIAAAMLLSEMNDPVSISFNKTIS